jgi:hypothetical protein
MSEEPRDPLIALLSRLPQAEPRAGATECVRTRCHVLLERQQARRARPSRTAAARLVDATLVFAGGFYLVVTLGAAANLIR